MITYNVYGLRREKKNLRHFWKSEDPDQQSRPWRGCWSGNSLFSTCLATRDVFSRYTKNFIKIYKLFIVEHLGPYSRNAGQL